MPSPHRRALATVLHAVAGGLLAVLTISFTLTVAPPLVSAVGPTSAFHAVTPTRLADTRIGFGTTPAGRLGAGASLDVTIVGRSEISVPADAVAVVLNVTTAAADGVGYLSVFPSGTAVPNASNLNPTRSDFTGANLVTVGLGRGGSVAVFSSVATHVLVDISGYYAPSGATAAGRTVPAGPQRVYDTRSMNGGAGAQLAAGEYRTITLAGLPATAAAAVLDVTAVSTSAPGFWSVVEPRSVVDRTAPPSTSSLNVTSADSTVAGQVMIPVGADHRIVVYTSGGGHLLIDLFGYVTGPTAPVSNDGLFVPLDAPARLLDTRTANSPLGEGHRMWPGWTVEASTGGRSGIPSSGVAAVVGNLTSVDAHEPGWLAAYPAGVTFPGTSNLNNDTAGTVVPNHVFSPVSSRGVAVQAAAGGHVLLDVAGYFTGSPTATTVGVPINALPIPTFPMTLSIPAIGLRTALQHDSQEADLQRGPGWWPGTSYPGVSGNMAVFGHRTEGPAPFRNVNRLRRGDTVVITGDRRTSVYVVQGWKVVTAEAVENDVAPSDSTILTLIACSRPDGTATSLAYRIVVTATLQSYRDA